MLTILIVVLLLFLVLGGGGYYGHRAGWWQRGGYGYGNVPPQSPLPPQPGYGPGSIPTNVAPDGTPLGTTGTTIDPRPPPMAPQPPIDNRAYLHSYSGYYPLGAIALVIVVLLILLVLGII